MRAIEIQTIGGDGQFPAEIAMPDGPARGTVIVIQEIFGVNEGIRRKCAYWAERNYVAIAPDLFWRLEPGVMLDPDRTEEFERALGLMKRFDQDKGIEDIEAVIREARRRTPRTRVGCVGYCLGGRLAFMTAARTDIDASVAYYGVGLDSLLHERHAIARPLLLHIAGDDHFVPPEKQRAVHAGLDDHPKVTIHDYPGMDHGFAAEMGNRRNEKAAGLADRRSEAFLAEHIG